MTTSTARQQYREVLASLVAKTQAKFPDLNGRLTKATRLALMEDVALHDDGSATVSSASDPTRHYRIVEGTCTCRDWEQAPEHLCCHRLAVGFQRKVHELLPPAPEPPAALPLATQADIDQCVHASVSEALSTLQPALPEAPASVNVRVTIAGRECQLTLRDTDEWHLLQRLEEVLQRFPQTATPPASPAPSQPQPPAQPTDQAPQCPTHGAMKPSSKGKGWYCPHKNQDGTWCASKAK
jgi:hypothetical protein